MKQNRDLIDLDIDGGFFVLFVLVSGTILIGFFGWNHNFDAMLISISYTGFGVLDLINKMRIAYLKDRWEK